MTLRPTRFFALATLMATLAIVSCSDDESDPTIYDGRIVIADQSIFAFDREDTASLIEFAQYDNDLYVEMNFEVDEDVEQNTSNGFNVLRETTELQIDSVEAVVYVDGRSVYLAEYYLARVSLVATFENDICSINSVPELVTREVDEITRTLEVDSSSIVVGTATDCSLDSRDYFQLDMTLNDAFQPAEVDARVIEPTLGEALYIRSDVRIGFLGLEQDSRRLVFYNENRAQLWEVQFDDDGSDLRLLEGNENVVIIIAQSQIYFMTHREIIELNNLSNVSTVPGTISPEDFTAFSQIQLDEPSGQRIEVYGASLNVILRIDDELYEYADGFVEDVHTLSSGDQDIRVGPTNNNFFGLIKNQAEQESLSIIYTSSKTEQVILLADEINLVSSDSLLLVNSYSEAESQFTASVIRDDFTLFSYADSTWAAMQIPNSNSFVNFLRTDNDPVISITRPNLFSFDLEAQTPITRITELETEDNLAVMRGRLFANDQGIFNYVSGSILSSSIDQLEFIDPTEDADEDEDE